MRDSDAKTAAAKAKVLSQADVALQERIATEFYDDPLGYVLFAFPWGEKGTPLAEQSGPDKWQAQVLNELGAAVRAGLNIDDAMPIMAAVASGHGIGKTALISWIVKWFSATRAHPEIIVTAGKKDQLVGKTWRELAKWNRLAIDKHLFHWTATKFYHVAHPNTWFAHAIAWSKNTPENFAGTHEKHVLVVYDEASAIDDVIWESTDGAMTTPGAMWIAFGNPTRNTGRFAQCFGRFKGLWTIRHQIDSRTAKMANRRLLDTWVTLYGEDSDFVRVRVRGMFPRAGVLQLIGNDVVRQAMARKLEIHEYREAAKVMGVDVARHGDDQNVVTRRQGRKVWPQKRWRETNTVLASTTIAMRVAEEINDFQPDMVFVDCTGGWGWAVYERLVTMGFGSRVTAVQVSEVANKPEQFFNLRSEMWWNMKAAIEQGADLPDDMELENELTGVEYGYNGDRIQLEAKDDTKERLDGASPDSADSLALTYTAPVQAGRAKESETWRKRLRAKLRAGRRSAMAA